MNTLSPALTHETKEYIIISASRTKDPVKNQPQMLAEMLCGRVPVKKYRMASQALLNLDEVGAVILWTKDPRPLTREPTLTDTLRRLSAMNIGVFLQLTVTGFGGGPVEPGIPTPEEAALGLQAALDANLFPPTAVKLRYDPVGRFNHHGQRYDNLDIERFHVTVSPLFDLGVTRLTASLVDIVNYKRSQKRLTAHDVSCSPISPLDAGGFISSLDERCAAGGINFSVCVSPAVAAAGREGCIDGAWVNQVNQSRFGAAARPVTLIAHNRRGAQRPGCTCTFSYDLGYSRGLRQCKGFGSYCLYCYSMS